MEVQEIGRQLKVMRLMSTLHRRVSAVRPTLSFDTVYRAFSQVECTSELLEVIREEGKRLLSEVNTVSMPEAA